MDGLGKGGEAGDACLAEEALRLAREQDPTLDLGRHLGRLRTLAGRALARVPAQAGIGDRLFALNATLFDELGFGPAADPVPDPRDCLLHHVLERRAGDAVALGIVYIAVGRRMGLPLEGLAFPGRFLVMLPAAAEPLVLDPCCGGTTLSRDDLEFLLLEVWGPERAQRTRLDALLRPADHHEILARLLHNLKLGYLEAQAPEQALWAVNRILDLYPDHALTLRDRARLFELLDCPRPACADYLRYLELTPHAGDAARIRARVVRLRARAVVLH